MSPRNGLAFKARMMFREPERADPASRRLQGNGGRAAAREDGEPRATIGLKGDQRRSFPELNRRDFGIRSFGHHRHSVANDQRLDVAKPDRDLEPA